MAKLVARSLCNDFLTACTVIFDLSRQIQINRCYGSTLSSNSVQKTNKVFIV
jgi:hypothetical protein